MEGVSHAPVSDRWSHGVALRSTQGPDRQGLRVEVRVPQAAQGSQQEGRGRLPRLHGQGRGWYHDSDREGQRVVQHPGRRVPQEGRGVPGEGEEARTPGSSARSVSSFYKI